MSGRPKLAIAESLSTLKKLMKKQPTVLGYAKVQALYLFKSKQAKTVREVATLLGKGEATIPRWLRLYREGGIEHLLRERKRTGRPPRFSVDTAAKLQNELRDPAGFSSYKEVHFWLEVVEGIFSSYQSVYRLVRYELKAKLKRPRPRSTRQAEGAIETFKAELGQRLKQLLERVASLKKTYSKVSYWCHDESRLGLHTTTGRAANTLRSEAH